MQCALPGEQVFHFQRVVCEVPGASERITSEPQASCVGTWLLPIVCWVEGLAWVRREPSERSPRARTAQGTLSWYLLLESSRRMEATVNYDSAHVSNKIKPHQVGPYPT